MGKKNVGQNCFWVKKNVGRIFFGSNKIGSEIFLGHKNVGFKFYFGLIRFVCVVLLTTAELNNNNTEFHWVVG